MRKHDALYKDPADSRLLVYDLCTMIGKHFDSMGCFVEYQKGGVANESSTHSDARRQILRAAANYCLVAMGPL